MKVVALAGGTGSAKLLRGLSKLPVDLTVIANVGDNVWMYGVYVCPDIDIASYTLAGVSDSAKGWGIAGDTSEVMSQLSRLGEDTWFHMGDRDFAVSLARTALLKTGSTLTQATGRITKALGVPCPVLPASDDPVETRVTTPKGDLHLQEFWVKEGGRPRVSRVWYKGARAASVAGPARRAILSADRVVLCPANPITSIGPTLAIPGFVSLLKDAKAKVVALSPMVGKGPYSGPAGRLMRAGGHRSDSLGVAHMYSRFLDRLLISNEDAHLSAGVEAEGVACTITDTGLRDRADELRLARELLDT